MESPSTKHFSSTGFTVTVSLFPTFFPFSASSNSSSSALFLRFSSSIWIWASLSFSSKTRSLSDLHLSQFHFSLYATWNLTFPQLLWYHRSHDSQWVPDFKFLSQPLHKTCTLLSTGPGFSSTPPIINNVAITAAHRIIVPYRYFLLSFRRGLPLTAMKTSRPRYPPEPGTLPGSNPLSRS